MTSDYSLRLRSHCQAQSMCTPPSPTIAWKGGTQVWFTSTEAAFSNSSSFLHGHRSQNVTLHFPLHVPHSSFLYFPSFSVQYKRTSNPGLGQQSVTCLTTAVVGNSAMSSCSAVREQVMSKKDSKSLLVTKYRR